MSPPIRAATKDDVTACMGLLHALNERGEATEPRYRIRPDTRDDIRAYHLDQWFGSFLPFPTVWVAEREGEVVGFISGVITKPHPVLERPPTATIDNLFVSPSARGHGLGRRLVEAFCTAATGAGFERIDVGTLAADTRAGSDSVLPKPFNISTGSDS